MTTVFLHVLSMSLTASIVILAVIAARFCLRRAPKKISYWLWLAVAFRLCCPVSWNSPFSLFSVVPVQTRAEQAVAELAMEETDAPIPALTDSQADLPDIGSAPVPELALPSDEPANPVPEVISSDPETRTAEGIPEHALDAPANPISLGGGPDMSSAPMTPADPITPTPESPAAVFPDPVPSPVPTDPILTAEPDESPAAEPAIAEEPEASPVRADRTARILFAASVVWLAGVGAMLIYAAASTLSVRRAMETAIPFEEGVWQSDCIRSPFLLGAIRPRIYIPFGTEGDMLRYVLAHERYHIRRRDSAAKVFAFLLLAAHWFNPFVWLAFALMTRDMEMSCDEYVLSTEPDIRKSYSYSLLSFASGRRFPSPSPLSFGEGDVKSRIRNVLNWERPKRWVTVTSILLAVTAAIFCMANPMEKKAPEEAEGTVEAVISDDEAETEAAEEPADLFDDAGLEPPLPETFLENLTVPVPDFLDAEQRNLFLRAEAVFPALAGRPEILRNYPPDSEPVVPEEWPEVEGYFPLGGRYARYADFEAMALSIFTDEYFEYLNVTRSPMGEPYFRDVDGWTYYLDVGVGGSEILVDYELIESTADRLLFRQINRFGNSRPEEDVTAYDVFAAEIEMLRGEDGWRVNAFVTEDGITHRMDGSQPEYLGTESVYPEPPADDPFAPRFVSAKLTPSTVGGTLAESEVLSPTETFPLYAISNTAPDGFSAEVDRWRARLDSPLVSDSSFLLAIEEIPDLIFDVNPYASAESVFWQGERYVIPRTFRLRSEDFHILRLDIGVLVWNGANFGVVEACEDEQRFALFTDRGVWWIKNSPAFTRETLMFDAYDESELSYMRHANAALAAEDNAADTVLLLHDHPDGLWHESGVIGFDEDGAPVFEPYRESRSTVSDWYTHQVITKYGSDGSMERLRFAADLADGITHEANAIIEALGGITVQLDNASEETDTYALNADRAERSKRLDLVNRAKSLAAEDLEAVLRTWVEETARSSTRAEIEKRLAELDYQRIQAANDMSSASAKSREYDAEITSLRAVLDSPSSNADDRILASDRLAALEPLRDQQEALVERCLAVIKTCGREITWYRAVLEARLFTKDEAKSVADYMIRQMITDEWLEDGFRPGLEQAKTFVFLIGMMKSNAEHIPVPAALTTLWDSELDGIPSSNAFRVASEMFGLYPDDPAEFVPPYMAYDSTEDCYRRQSGFGLSHGYFDYEDIYAEEDENSVTVYFELMSHTYDPERDVHVGIYADETIDYGEYCIVFEHPENLREAELPRIRFVKSETLARERAENETLPADVLWEKKVRGLYADMIEERYTDASYQPTAAELCDLDGDGVPELIVFRQMTESSHPLDIYCIENGSVCAFASPFDMPRSAGSMPDYDRNLSSLLDAEASPDKLIGFFRSESGTVLFGSYVGSEFYASYRCYQFSRTSRTLRMREIFSVEWMGEWYGDETMRNRTFMNGEEIDGGREAFDRAWDGWVSDCAIAYGSFSTFASDEWFLNNPGDSYPSPPITSWLRREWQADAFHEKGLFTPEETALVANQLITLTMKPEWMTDGDFRSAAGIFKLFGVSDTRYGEDYPDVFLEMIHDGPSGYAIYPNDLKRLAVEFAGVPEVEFHIDDYLDNITGYDPVRGEVYVVPTEGPVPRYEPENLTVEVREDGTAARFALYKVEYSMGYPRELLEKSFLGDWEITFTAQGEGKLPRMRFGLAADTPYLFRLLPPGEPPANVYETVMDFTEYSAAQANMTVNDLTARLRDEAGGRPILLSFDRPDGLAFLLGEIAEGSQTSFGVSGISYQGAFYPLPVGLPFRDGWFAFDDTMNGGSRAYAAPPSGGAMNTQGIVLLHDGQVWWTENDPVITGETLYIGAGDGLYYSRVNNQWFFSLTQDFSSVFYISGIRNDELFTETGGVDYAADGLPRLVPQTTETADAFFQERYVNLAFTNGQLYDGFRYVWKWGKITLEDWEDYLAACRSADGAEPPLFPQSAAIPVPDFLDAEQADLFRRAEQVNPAFCGVCDTLDYVLPPLTEGFFPFDNGQDDTPLMQNGNRYVPLHGRYADWETFQKMGRSLYTEEFWAALSKPYISSDGRTYVLDSGMGGLFSLSEYELLESTVDRLLFRRIVKQALASLDEEPTGYACYGYLIEMVKTADGWRINAFADGAGHSIGQSGEYLYTESNPSDGAPVIQKIPYSPVFTGLNGRTFSPFTVDLPVSWQTLATADLRGGAYPMVSFFTGDGSTANAWEYLFSWLVTTNEISWDGTELPGMRFGDDICTFEDASGRYYSMQFALMSGSEEHWTTADGDAQSVIAEYADVLASLRPNDGYRIVHAEPGSPVVKHWAKYTAVSIPFTPAGERRFVNLPLAVPTESGSEIVPAVMFSVPDSSLWAGGTEIRRDIGIDESGATVLTFRFADSGFPFFSIRAALIPWQEAPGPIRLLPHERHLKTCEVSVNGEIHWCRVTASFFDDEARRTITAPGGRNRPFTQLPDEVQIALTLEAEYILSTVQSAEPNTDSVRGNLPGNLITGGTTATDLLGRIYFEDPLTRTLRRMNADGSHLIELAPERAGSISVFGGQVIYDNAQNAIRSVPIDGGEAVTLWQAPRDSLYAPNIGKIFVTPDGIWFGARIDAKQRVFHMNLDGSGAREVFTGYSLSGVDSGQVFVADSEGLYRFEPVSYDPTQIVLEQIWEGTLVSAVIDEYGIAIHSNLETIIILDRYTLEEIYSTRCTYPEYLWADGKLSLYGYTGAHGDQWVIRQTDVRAGLTKEILTFGEEIFDSLGRTFGITFYEYFRAPDSEAVRQAFAAEHPELADRNGEIWVLDQSPQGALQAVNGEVWCFARSVKLVRETGSTDNWLICDGADGTVPAGLRKE